MMSKCFVLIGLIFLSLSAYAYLPAPLTKQTDFPQYRDILEFEYRASKIHLDILPKDLALIDEYIKLNDEITLQDYEKARGTAYLFRAVYQALLYDKLPTSHIEPVNQLAITAHNYDQPKLKEIIGHGFVPHFKQLMWLIELRRIQDKDEFIDYLKQSLKEKSDNELILKVLIQHNLHRQIQQWFADTEIKGIELLIVHLKTREKITTEINTNKDTFTLLKTEYVQLNNHIFQSFEAAVQDEKELMIQQSDWLLKQLNNYKFNPDIENFLKKINADWLQFNHESLGLITGDNPQEIFKKINYELKVMWKTDEILKNIIRYNEFDGNLIGRNRKLFEAHLKIFKDQVK